MATLPRLETIQKEAIGLIIDEHTTENRYGLMMTSQQKESLIKELYQFIMQTNRIQKMGTQGIVDSDDTRTI